MDAHDRIMARGTIETFFRAVMCAAVVVIFYTFG